MVDNHNGNVYSDHDGSTNLENEVENEANLQNSEGEELVGDNDKKIRRRFERNGVLIWICADNEQDYADQLFSLRDSSTNSTREKHRFREYADTWFEVFSKPNIATVTSVTYERQLARHIYPVLGDKMIEDITPADVQRVFNAMPRDAKQWTKQKVKVVLNQVFNMAVEDGLMVRNPLQSSSIRIKGQAASVTEPYSVEQMRYFMTHLGDVMDATDRAWLALSVNLPLRPEEVLGLKWEDIDRENCVLHVRNTVTHPARNKPEFKPYTKTASSIRTLAFPEEMMAYLPESGPDHEFIIGGATPISYTQLRRMRNRIAKNIGFDEAIVPRRFRTTVATDISAQTHDLKLVQQVLGHSNPQMTLKHYDKGRSQAVDASDAIRKCYWATES